MTRACQQCGRPFEAKRSTAKYCGSGCRARRARGAASVVEPMDAHRQELLPFAFDLRLPDPGEVTEPSIVVAVRAELAQAGRLDSALGQAALALAQLFGAETGSALASVSRELRATLTEALAGARPQQRSALDELRERTRSKRDASVTVLRPRGGAS
jgi:hypothetical protein